MKTKQIFQTLPSHCLRYMYIRMYIRMGIYRRQWSSKLSLQLIHIHGGCGSIHSKRDCVVSPTFFHSPSILLLPLVPLHIPYISNHPPPPVHSSQYNSLQLLIPPYSSLVVAVYTVSFGRHSDPAHDPSCTRRYCARHLIHKPVGINKRYTHPLVPILCP